MRKILPFKLECDGDIFFHFSANLKRANKNSFGLLKSGFLHNSHPFKWDPFLMQALSYSNELWSNQIYMEGD